MEDQEIHISDARVQYVVGDGVGVIESPPGTHVTNDGNINIVKDVIVDSKDKDELISEDEVKRVEEYSYGASIQAVESYRIRALIGSSKLGTDRETWECGLELYKDEIQTTYRPQFNDVTIAYGKSDEPLVTAARFGPEYSEAIVDAYGALRSMSNDITDAESRLEAIESDVETQLSSLNWDDIEFDSFCE